MKNNSKQYLISVTIMGVFIRNMKSDEIFIKTSKQKEEFFMESLKQ